MKKLDLDVPNNDGDAWKDGGELSPTGFAETRGPGRTRRRSVIQARRSCSKTARRKKKRVSFRSVEVREMFIHIAESAVPQDGGPPIGISPVMKRSLTHDIDCFELERETGRRLKRAIGSPMPQRLGKERFALEGRLPASMRRKMLEEAETQGTKIIEAEKDVQKIIQSRMESIRSLGYKAVLEEMPIDDLKPSRRSVVGPLDGVEETDKIGESLKLDDRFFGVADLF